MKNILTSVTLWVLIMCAGKASAQNDPINVWVAWDCAVGQTFGTVTTGDRKGALQYFAPWEEGVREVWYSYPVMGAGTQWAYYGQATPGLNLFEVSHLTNTPYFYWHDLNTALAFVDPENPDDEALVTVPVTIRTEPMPYLTVEVVEQVGTEATIRVRSWAQMIPNTGFGGQDMYICPEFRLSIEVTVNDWENGVITTHFIDVTPGAVTDEILTIGNPNSVSTQFCITAKMVRLHDSDVPIFDPRLITTSGSEVCVTLGGNLTTTISEQDDDQRRHPFPNPFTNHLSVEMKGEWLITNILGQVVLTGKGNQTTSTEAWKPGAYVVRTSDGSFTVLKE